MNLPTIHQRLLNARRELEIIFAKECVAEYNASKRTNMNTRWDVPEASPSLEVFDSTMVKRTNEDEAPQSLPAPRTPKYKVGDRIKDERETGVIHSIYLTSNRGFVYCIWRKGFHGKILGNACIPEEKVTKHTPSKPRHQ